MKNLRHLFATLVLTFVLCNAAFARDGIIWTGYVPPPPPSTPSSTGVIHGDFAEPGEESEETTVDSATEVALSLVQSILALF